MGGNKVAHLPAECGELRDAIGADAVDAELLQGFPLAGVVGCPGDDPGINRVGARDEIFVDKRRLLPEVLRLRGPKRADGIYVTRILQYSGSDGWENTLHCFDNTMIESVHSTGRVGFTDNPHDERLYASCLDLHVNSGPTADRIEDRFECRNLDAVRQTEVAHFGCR